MSSLEFSGNNDFSNDSEPELNLQKKWSKFQELERKISQCFKELLNFRVSNLIDPKELEINFYDSEIQEVENLINYIKSNFNSEINRLFYPELLLDLYQILSIKKDFAEIAGLKNNYFDEGDLTLEVGYIIENLVYLFNSPEYKKFLELVLLHQINNETQLIKDLIGVKANVLKNYTIALLKLYHYLLRETVLNYYDILSKQTDCESLLDSLKAILINLHKLIDTKSQIEITNEKNQISKFLMQIWLSYFLFFNKSTSGKIDF